LLITEDQNGRFETREGFIHGKAISEIADY
jgi:hypothetical protein